MGAFLKGITHHTGRHVLCGEAGKIDGAGSHHAFMEP